MKGFILKSHEAQALAAGKPVVIWRACKVQPVMHRWEHESMNPPFHDAMGFVGKEICAPGYLAIGVDRAMESTGYLRIPFPVGIPLFGKETWRGVERGDFHNLIKYKADGAEVMYPPGQQRYWQVGDMSRWRSPSHLPEWASRITLTLSDVKVRRPCDATEEEKAEMAVGMRIIPDYLRICQLYHFTALATPQPKNS